jgi:hypothetical protein
MSGHFHTTRDGTHYNAATPSFIELPVLTT